MICPQSQSENLPDSFFCDHCGVRLETACSYCGEPNRRGARFCRICGQTIAQTATATAKVPEVPSPATYLPRHLAEKIFPLRRTLEGERKQVTVLFADIRGSTKLLEGLDREDAQKLIDPVLHVMMDAVHRYEGTVNQVLGYGIMALFGAPLAHEDHAVRACYAAHRTLSSQPWRAIRANTPKRQGSEGLSTAIDRYSFMEMRAGLREAEIAPAKIADTVPSARQRS